MTDVLSPIVAETRINAPIAHAWTVLTSSATVPAWLGCLNYWGEEGSTFHMQQDRAKWASGDITGATHCDIVLMQAPHKFNFTWHVPGTPKTTVEISLFSEGVSQSFARLVHSGWEQFPVAEVAGIHQALTAGWRDSVLPHFKAAAERN